VVDEVEYQALYMAAVVILISHDQDRSIPKRVYVRVDLANFEADYLGEVLDFLVFAYLLCTRLANIQKLAL